MDFSSMIAQTLTEVPKSDLVSGKKYLMVDEEHAVVIETRIGEEGLLATPAASYLCGFHVVNFQTFNLAYVNNGFVKFFQLPA